jgi:hypothetical protein
MSYQYEGPSEYDLMVMERQSMGFPAIGPLTQAQYEQQVAYDVYCEESEREHLACQAAGGRTICPMCGERQVVHTAVRTYGTPNHPESEYSDFAKCGHCGHEELAG